MSSKLLKIAIAASVIATSTSAFAENLDINTPDNNNLNVAIQENNNTDKNSDYITNINNNTNLMAEEQTTNPIIVSLNQVFEKSGQIINSQVTNDIANYFNNTNDNTITIDNTKFIPNTNNLTVNNDNKLSGSTKIMLASTIPPTSTNDETYKYIHGEITPEDKTFNMTADDNASKNLGTMEVTELTINGGSDTKYAINGNNFEGVTVNDGQTLTIKNAAIEGFTSSNGGAINNQDATLTITDSTFENNAASSLAGAVISGAYTSSANLTITNTDFISNTSDYAGGAVANGSYTDNATATITGGLFKENTSSMGGAIGIASYGGTSTTKITDATFESNYAAELAGAVMNSAMDGAKAVLNVTGGKFNGNYSNNLGGGAIGNGSYDTGIAETNIDNVVFENNYLDAGMFGAAVLNGAFNGQATTTINNSSFTNNYIKNANDSTISGGGAVANGAFAGAANLTITGSSFNGNHTDGTANGGALLNASLGGDVITTIIDTSFSNNYTAETGLGGAIYNDVLAPSTATLNIAAIGSNVAFTNNKAGDNLNDIYNNAVTNINVNEGKSVSFAGSITGISGIININATHAQISSVPDSLSAYTLGTVIFNNDVSGQNAVNLYNGTLQLGSKAAEDKLAIKAPTVSNLNYYGGTVSLINDLASDNFTVAKIDTDKTMNLAIDVDFQNIIDEVNNISASDMIKINGTNKNIQITSLNVLNDFDGTNSGKIKISDGSTGDVHSAAVTIYQDTYKYVLSESNSNVIDVNRGFSHGLYEAIKDTTSPTITYNVDAQENIVDDLGDLVPTTLNIVGDGNYGIDGNNHKGITVGAGKTLNITNVGSLNDDGTVKTSINGFNNSSMGSVVFNDGTTNITNSVLYNNKGTNISAGSTVFSLTGDLSVTNSTFMNNAAMAGGAIYSGNNTTISDSKFIGNIAGSNLLGIGGAIYNSGKLNISNSLFKDNVSNALFSSAGGAIYNVSNSAGQKGDATITNTIFENNTADNGGAIYNSALLTLENTTFNGNIATKNGGAVYNDTGAEIKNITGGFSKNYAKASGDAKGGAIYNAGTIENIKNSISDTSEDILSNTTENGGTIFNSGTVETPTGEFTDNGGTIFNSGTVETPTGEFTDNGGTIFNSGTIETPTGEFTDNGGTIFNSGTVETPTGEFTDNGGTIFNSGTIETPTIKFITNSNTDIFAENYAESTTGDASGGAVYNDTGAEIKNITGGFSKNYAKASGDAKGGAIYNAGIIGITNSLFTDNEATGTNANGGAIYNNLDATLNLNGYNIFINNTANEVKNDIENNGTMNINGTTIFDGGVTGIGTMNLKENSSADFSQGKLAQGEVVVSNGSALNIANQNTENLQEFSIQDGGTANVAIDFTDKMNTTNVDKVKGSISIKAVDMKNITAESSTELSTTLGNHIYLAEDIEFFNQDDNINFLQLLKNDKTATLHAKETNLNNIIHNSDTNEAAVYIMKTDEKIDVGNKVKGTTGSELVIRGSGNSVTDGSVIIESGITYTNIDTNYENNKTDGDDNAKAAITVKPNATINLVAQNHDVAIINTDNDNAIYLESNDTGNSTANFTAADGRTIKIQDDIISDNKANVVNFNGGSVEFNGIFDPATANVNSGTVTRNGYDDDITYNLNGGTLKYDNDKYVYDPSMHGSIYQLNSMNFNGGALDLMNYAVNNIQLNSLNINSNSNLYVDADLRNERMDTLNANSITVTDDAKLHVNGVNLLSDTDFSNVKINFTKDGTLKKAVDYTGSQGIAYSPLYKYNVSYDSETGNFNFVKDPHEFNPAITTAGIAQQMAFLNQVNSYDEAFANMDTIMLMPRYQRIAMKTRNKYAQMLEGNTYVAYDKQTVAEENSGGWFRPYASMERVALNNGPAVGNTSYGALVGGDTGIIELKKGWESIYSFYGGYNGSHQHHEGNSIYQNGGLLGATATFYKGDFFTGVTANFGASQANASTTLGNEDFTMLTTGIASKTGYNFEFFNGKFIVQPSWLMSYSFISTFNYRNSAGYAIESDPLHAIQLVPGLKFIGNLPHGWQPYLIFQGVWNIMDETKFRANDVALPQMSVNPYVQYGVGVQKHFGERFTGALQATFRNGGRNGAAFAANFRYALGKAPEKLINQNEPEIKHINFDKKIIDINANKNN